MSLAHAAAPPPPQVRLAAFVEPTIFKSVLYHPEESQILTCGTNFKVAYYDAYDGWVSSSDWP